MYRERISRRKESRLGARAIVGGSVLVVVFATARVLLLTTSYDANVNWEEPVFLFSGLKLAREGIGAIFAHQDDLNHGGSLPLVVLAVPWLKVFGTSLLQLKGIAILWSTATLVAILAVTARFFSARAALLVGVLVLVASPTLARLQITLVGSHPESLLPCALALGAYLAWVEERRRGRERRATTVWLGLWSGLAVWMSYVALLFAAPLLTARVVGVRDRRMLVGGAAGFLAGVSPWFVQNLWLRPHGARLWTGHVREESSPGLAEPVVRVVAELAASFGWGTTVGAIELAALVVLLLAATGWLVTPGHDRWRLLPFVAAPYVGFAMLVAARLPAGHEGYYHYRFYAALQVALFWVAAIALDRLWPRQSPRGVAVVVGLVALGGMVAQADGFGRGNHYVPDLVRDRARGCLVYGVAESTRAVSWEAAIARLRTLTDPACRDRAFAGLGWGVAGRFAATRDVEATKATLRLIADPSARWSACGGLHFAVRRSPAGSVSDAEWAKAWSEIRTLCVRP